MRAPVRTTYWAILCLLYGIAASQALWSFANKWTTIMDHPQYSLSMTLAGEAPKPYAYRILMPATVHFIAQNMPRPIAAIIEERAVRTLQRSLEDGSKIDRRMATPYGIALLLNFAFLFATLLMLRQLGRLLLLSSGVGDRPSSPDPILDAAPILFALLLTISYRADNGFIYDHLELLLLSSYLLAAASGRSVLSLVILPLAVLNKETAIFYPIFGGIIRWYQASQTPMHDRAKTTLLEFAIVLSLFFGVRVHLSDHPGASTEWHFFGNLEFWLSWRPWVNITSPHSPLIMMPKPSNLIVLLPLLTAIFGYWKYKPKICRALLMGSGGISGPLFILFCYRDEFRNLSLMFPFLYLVSAHSVHIFYARQAPQQLPNRNSKESAPELHPQLKARLPGAELEPQVLDTPARALAST